MTTHSKIKELAKEGKTKTEIGKIVGMDRKQVRKVLKPESKEGMFNVAENDCWLTGKIRIS